MGDGVLQLSITDKTKGIISKLLFHISNDYNEFFLRSLLGYLFTIFRIQIFFFIDNNSTLTMPPPIYSHLLNTEDMKNSKTIYGLKEQHGMWNGNSRRQVVLSL